MLSLQPSSDPTVQHTAENKGSSAAHKPNGEFAPNWSALGTLNCSRPVGIQNRADREIKQRTSLALPGIGGHLAKLDGTLVVVVASARAGAWKHAEGPRFTPINFSNFP